MQLEVIGVGGAGCRIADAILERESEQRRFVGDAFAFDTDAESTAALEAIPEQHCHWFGDTIDEGLNGNLDRGFEVGEEYVDELGRILDEGRPSLADAFFLVVGSGGATGGGVVPHLISRLQSVYDKPVYVLAALPAKSELRTDETAGIDRQATADSAAGVGEARPMAEENTVRTLKRIDGLADAVICFDNEAWLHTDEKLADARDRLNRGLATRLEALFGASAAAEGDVAETVIDASDVARILDATDGTTTATLGYGAQTVETDDGGSRFGLGLIPTESSVDTTEAVSAVETTVNKALHGKLTLECDLEDVNRTMVVVGGPPDWLNRKGIADGRQTVQSETGSAQLLGGDAPRPDSDEVYTVLLLAGIEASDRLASLWRSPR
ncbi:tubulin/FtsZ family protein [Natronobacterium gregoryi]|uniref:Tubulin-like protein CetZ n=2 Tax=Natronobacterium gregoryi TaxID=44930 RepID=L0AHD9_NATGS|nr:tubulin/FtsZ family protein [Natronobacterium gregoryi]AFZ72572.1 cell division GTPase [Natronobacterium gregoryi SP2]ELY71909.1 tubulin [Natronobacterium gregoryi SP2]PLK19347.1 cell division protein FtsZ [Natronobacterium gregoryi SP2]SFJ52293.1 Cell division GTPase FtsZ [Natronobacterium gregoryi]